MSEKENSYNESSHKLFPSIFCMINGRPPENIYPDNMYFENFELDNICYPKTIKTTKESPFPNESDLWKAIDYCVDRANDTEKPILLVSGDLSGIQDTIYTISSKGALKSLRARSFMLELLCEHICYELVMALTGKKDKLTYQELRNHVVYSGGGSFCLVLPNIDDSILQISQFKKTLNDWAFQEFSGKLYIAMKSVAAEKTELENGNIFHQKIWKPLSDKLERDKQRKFYWKLENIFSEDFVIEPTLRTNQQECQICHRDNIDFRKNEKMFDLTSGKNDFAIPEDIAREIDENPSAIMVTELSYRLYYLGDRLTEKEYICRAKNSRDKKAYIRFPVLKQSKLDAEFYELECVSYWLGEKNDKAEFTWKINDDKNTLPFLYASYVRKVSELPVDARKKDRDLYEEEHGKVLRKENEKTTSASFTGLAHAACGADFIGALRMDVDNLGKIISTGLGEHLTIYTLAQLSYMLNVFFKVYLNKICLGELGHDENGIKIKPIDLTGKDYPNNNGRNVSIIYAGGDDLFIIGAWDETAELAYDIQRCFRRFSGLGISGGLTLHKAKYPLYQMVKMAGEAEYEAKMFKLLETEYKSDEPLKNKFVPFYTSFYKQKSKDLNDRAEEERKARRNGRFDKLVYALPWEDTLPLDIIQKFVDFCTEEDGRLELQNISRGFLYKLFRLAEVWWEQEVLYVPQYIYLIERIRKSLNIKPENEEQTKQFDALKDLIIKRPLLGNQHKAVRSLKIPLTWIDLYQRRKGV